LGIPNCPRDFAQIDRAVVLDGAAYGVAHARFGGDLELSGLSTG